MAEFWVGGGATETTKMVSASAHTHGKNIVGAESFTADDQHAKWLYDPYSIKALGDKMYSLGINRFIFHRYALQPWLNLEPGMTMGPWGTNFDRTITWWDQGRAWIQYLTRCQYMLQSGLFQADVLAFEGDDGPNDLPLMRGTTVPNGYDYDGCDTKTLLQAHVENGQIVLPSGTRYRLLMLPETTWMTAKTMRKINDLVHSGATILGNKPLKSPTYTDKGGGDQAVSELATKLWTGHTGSGKVYAGKTVAQALAAMGIKEDLHSPKPLNWIHRKAGDADIYFVANPSYAPVEMKATFRVTGKQPEIWNPETGLMDKSLAWTGDAQSTTVPLRLESAGSEFVVFRSPAPAQHLTAIKWLGEAEKEPPAPKIEIVSAVYTATDGAGSVDVTGKVKTMVQAGETNIQATNSNFGDPTINHAKELRLVYIIDGKRHQQSIPENEGIDLITPNSSDARPHYLLENGKLALWAPGKVEVETTGLSIHYLKGAPTETPLTRPWSITFPPGKGAPASATFDKLASWTESKIDGIKYFSGTATYRTSFNSPELMLKDGAYWLDLGHVKNFAEVTLNGHSLPTLWKAPFRIDVSPWLKKGENALEVKITNLWPNRLIGDEQVPPDATYNGPIQSWPDWLKGDRPKLPGKRTTFTTWQFFKKDSPLLESGLIGPVKIVRVPLMNIAP
jgi:hypothetical protein